MNKDTIGYIYILTNPGFPDYIKIGYAIDVDKRLKELNRSECIPYAFRLYAYYKVNTPLTDKAVHRIIDNINPDLRAIDNFEGKQRKREFYAMTPEAAYNILEGIAEINGLTENLVLKQKTKEDIVAEQMAEEISEYSEEKFVNSNPNVKDLYYKIKNEILSLGNIIVEPKKLYIAFKRNTNVCDILLQKNKITVFINLKKGMLKDPEDLCQDVSDKGHWGNGDYTYTIRSQDDITYCISLIKQSYNKN